MIWMGDDNYAGESSACRRPSCTRPVTPQRVRRSKEKTYCSDVCARQHWNEKHPRLGTQAALRFEPPAVAIIPDTVPPHDPKKRPSLHRAALHILGLLGDGMPHSRRELEKVGGNRYAARINAMRQAGHVVLGPRRQLRRGIEEIEPMQGGIEFYRLVIEARP